LRGYLREHDETKKLLAGLKNSQPALGWSHPEWLVARWQRRWGAERTGAIARMEQHAAENLCTASTRSGLAGAGSPLPAERTKAETARTE